MLSEQIYVASQDKLTGVTRQSRSERKEVQEAARRAAEGNSPRAPADAREVPPFYSILNDSSSCPSWSSTQFVTTFSKACV